MQDKALQSLLVKVVNVLKENKHTNHFNSQLREESHQDKGKVSRLDEKISKWMKL